jgi:rubrerythrin
MPTEKEKLIQAIKNAIQMEIDGKAFYLKASQASSNELGKKLLESMAKEEDYHRTKLEQVYETVCKTGVCPIVDFKSDGGRTLRTIFARALEKPARKTAVANSELEAIKMAMEMEDKSHDFYHTRFDQTRPGPEKDFYETVAAEEQEHKLVLTDYYEYLKDPGGFFVKTEHPSLDG